jgi:hypothetical protein
LLILIWTWDSLRAFNLCRGLVLITPPARAHAAAGAGGDPVVGPRARPRVPRGLQTVGRPGSRVINGSRVIKNEHSTEIGAWLTFRVHAHTKARMRRR